MKCLLVSLLLAVVECQVFDIRMYTTPGDTYCCNLQCVANSSLPVIGMTIYDITEKDNPVKLVSISMFAPELSIEQSQIHLINATGAISEYGGVLSINFTKAADCLNRSYQCELDFVDANGKPDVVKANMIGATEQNATELYTLADIATQLKALQQDIQLKALQQDSQLKALQQDIQLKALQQDNQLKALQQDNQLKALQQDNQLKALQQDNQLKALQQDNQLKALQQDNQLKALQQDNQVLKVMLGSVILQQSRLEELLNSTLNTQHDQPLGSVCYRGMPHKNAREKFILSGKVLALCDTETDGGGWVVIQRRVRGDVDFYRNWVDYKRGFGTPDTDFWIGNDIIHDLTSQGYNELRIDFVYNGTDYFAQYTNFIVADESSNYRLTISGHSGNTYDSMTFHNGRGFSTPDRDNDLADYSCSVDCHGSWWYTNCYDAHLNGAWAVTNYTSITWSYKSNGYWRPLTFTEMKIRYI